MISPQNPIPVRRVPMHPNKLLISKMVTRELTSEMFENLKPLLEPDKELFEDIFRLQAKRPSIGSKVLEHMSEMIVEFVLENDEYEWLIDEVREHQMNDFHVSLLNKVKFLSYPCPECLDTFMGCHAL